MRELWLYFKFQTWKLRTESCVGEFRIQTNIKAKYQRPISPHFNIYIPKKKKLLNFWIMRFLYLFSCLHAYIVLRLPVLRINIHKLPLQNYTTLNIVIYYRHCYMYATSEDPTYIYAQCSRIRTIIIPESNQSERSNITKLRQETKWMNIENDCS